MLFSIPVLPSMSALAVAHLLSFVTHDFDPKDDASFAALDRHWRLALDARRLERAGDPHRDAP